MLMKNLFRCAGVIFLQTLLFSCGDNLSNSSKLKSKKSMNTEKLTDRESKSGTQNLTINGKEFVLTLSKPQRKNNNFNQNTKKRLRYNSGGYASGGYASGGYKTIPEIDIYCFQNRCYQEPISTMTNCGHHTCLNYNGEVYDCRPRYEEMRCI